MDSIKHIANTEKRSLQKKSRYRSIGNKIRLPIMGILLIASIVSFFVFEIATSISLSRIIYNQASYEGEFVLHSLETRLNVVSESSELLGDSPAILESLELDDLTNLNRLAIQIRDRFELDLIQMYNGDGIARINLAMANLYKVSSLIDDIPENSTKLISVEDNLLLLSRTDLENNQGTIITGIDFDTELKRIAFLGNVIGVLGVVQGEIVDTASENRISGYLGSRDEANWSGVLNVGEEPVTLYVSRKSPEITRILNTSRTIMMISSLIMTIILLVLSDRVIRQITNPISELVEATKALAKVEFHQNTTQKYHISTYNNPLHIGVDDEIGELAASFTEMEFSLRSVYSGLLGDLRRSHDELREAYDATLEGWSSALDLRDHDTERHTHRVAQMSVELARQIGVQENRLTDIRRGALLHDIGKLAISDNVLKKPGPLSDDEWNVMRLHPTYAYTMLRKISYLGDALEIPYCHHENWNGTGYPRGLRDEEIPLSARIFAVIDNWDALSSDRPYRKAWPTQEIINYIKLEAGEKFDPDIVDAFIAWVDKNPGFLSKQ